MKAVNPEIFRDYDIRGTTDPEHLSSETAELLGRSFGTFLSQNSGKTTVIGHDNRISSRPLKTAFVKGLLSTGIDVIDIGMVVTPMVYFAQSFFGVDSAVMVTASHNPPEYNGFKVSCHGSNLFGDNIKALERIIHQESFLAGSGNLETANIFAAYHSMLRDKITLGNKKLKVVVDPGNGSAAPFAVRILSSFGCEVLAINDWSDPSFPNHFPDPVVAENLIQLQDAVIRENADLGIAFDGDADRIGVVDNEGQIVWGDKLMIVFWREILAKHSVVEALVEVKCSRALIDELQSQGLRPIFVRTGHSYIKKLMQERGALFTGEMSGHMFFADEYYGFDDAIYASARLLRILSHLPHSLAEELRKTPGYHTSPEIRIDCPDSIKFELVRQYTDYLSSRYPVTTVDGVRAEFQKGWGLIRASNTQPALVVRCEATTREALAEYLEIISELLKSHPETSPQARNLLESLPALSNCWPNQ